MTCCSCAFRCDALTPKRCAIHSWPSAANSISRRAGRACIPISKEVLAGQSVPGQGWTTPPPQERRRSVYVHVKRSLQLPILAIHDQADTDSSCPRLHDHRAHPALGHDQRPSINEQATALRPGSSENADPAARIRRAIMLTTCRKATDEEVAKDLSFIEELRTKGGMSPADAWRYYCLVQLNSNEFLYLDLTPMLSPRHKPLKPEPRAKVRLHPAREFPSLALQASRKTFGATHAFQTPYVRL